jgi:hypothetical protein
MTNELYSEGIGEVAVTGPVVRLDLLTLSLEQRDDKGQPKLVLCQRVVMPVEGLIRSYAVLSQAMQELEKRGVVRKHQAPEVPARQQAGPKPPPSSPNFS